MSEAVSDRLVCWAKTVVGGDTQSVAQWLSGVYSVVDCVFSAQARYESMVLPMLCERLPARPGLVDVPELTFSTFIADIRSFGEEPWDAYGKQVLNLQVLAGRRKVEVCHDIARFFVERGYETIEDLRALGEEGLVELVLGPLQTSIHGVGPALARYLLMLLGVESQVKFDVMLQRFFKQLCGQVPGFEGGIDMLAAEAAIRSAAERLGTTPARLDHAIWQFMSNGGTVELPEREADEEQPLDLPGHGADVAPAVEHVDRSAGVEQAQESLDHGDGPSQAVGRLAVDVGCGPASNPFARRFRRVAYKELNSRQKESYNFHKLAAELADFGFTCMQLADDWEGADFLAVHYLGDSVLKVQLKGRLTIDAKYVGKDLWIAFPHGGEWYMVEHERLVEIIGECTTFLESKSWAKGWYSTARPSKALLERLRPHRMTSSGAPSAEDLLELEQIQGRLHDLIRHRTAHLEGLEDLELPELDLDSTEEVSFPVPGLLGGFRYNLDRTGDELALIVESESRIFTGWEQRHRITADSCDLLEERSLGYGPPPISPGNKYGK